MVDLKFEQLKLTFLYMRLSLAATVGSTLDREKLGNVRGNN